MTQPTPPRTLNERLLDATIRRQLITRRAAEKIVRDILAELKVLDIRTINLLRNALGEELVDSVLKKILEERKQFIERTVREQVTVMVTEMNAIEIEHEDSLWEEILGAAILALFLLRPKIRTTGTTDVLGTDLKDWFRRLADDDSSRIVAAIRNGLRQELSTDQIVRSISSSVLINTQRNVRTIIETAISTERERVREAAWSPLIEGGYIRALRWTAVLDSRTSDICRSRDGALTPVGNWPLPPGSRRLEPPGARPPAHPKCRSTMTPVLGDNIRGLSPELIGSAAPRMSYDEWLRQQPPDIQDKVLGPTRGNLYRLGGLKVHEFSDASGELLSLEQLRLQRGFSFKR